MTGRIDNIQMLDDTLQIFNEGKYNKDGKIVYTKLSLKQMEECYVYLPEDVMDITNRKDFEHLHVMGRVGVGCQNIDSYSMAQQQYKHLSYMFSNGKAKNILVLNFANPVNPGGGVRRGARAQEEDLCRRSSLLLSLESQLAKQYYEYNKSLNTYLGSDAIILTPNVEIIKEVDGSMFDESIIVSVMTCAAPMITHGKEGLTEEEYQEMFYRRICGMLKCAAYWGYQVLVLGAFGCGAFGNDAKLVSDLFYKALKEFNFDGMMAKDFFRRIDFAVLDKTPEQYNFNEFNRNFEHFYRDEDNAEIERIENNKKAKEVHLDKIRGALIGGAIGDALGYPVEFLSADEIFYTYGEQGITDYVLDRQSGKALISDDTQMTLFTANGILVGETRSYIRGIGGSLQTYVSKSFQDWLLTQEMDYNNGRNTKRQNGFGGISWLLDVPELYRRRAPGNTCLSALYEARNEGYHGDYIKNPRNNSKGCGGIMRVAPLAIHYAGFPIDALDREAVALSAITHGHPLGYLPSAVLVHILNRIVYQKKKKSLKEIVVEARDAVCELFKDTEHIDELRAIIDRAIFCAENNESDRNNIKSLGEGWVAEETLAIAIYCSLRHEHDFSAGIIAAVNHDGDSDSTGAVAGNILGAINGLESIALKWKTNLELYDVIIEMADDLCYGCHMSEYGNYYDADWDRKYMKMHWKEEKPKDYISN